MKEGSKRIPIGMRQKTDHKMTDLNPVESMHMLNVKQLNQMAEIFRLNVKQQAPAK